MGTLCLFSKLLLYKHIWKDSPEQTASLLMKCTEMWQTHRELSSKHVLLRLEETGMNSGLRPSMQTCWCKDSSLGVALDSHLSFTYRHQIYQLSRSLVDSAFKIPLRILVFIYCLTAVTSFLPCAPIVWNNLLYFYFFFVLSYPFSLSPWSSQSGHSDHLQP